MAKRLFYWIAPSLFLFVLLLNLINDKFVHLYWLVLLYTLIGLYDLNSHRNVLRNYPVIGHLRYLLEYIRPEIQQYFIESNDNGRPFSREQRSVVYQRAKDVMDTLAFGTQKDVLQNGYYYTLHSLSPITLDVSEMSYLIGQKQCEQPYRASRLNISAMSFGALGHTSIEALNWGAKMGGFYLNTGEGGLTPYHLKHGGDIVLQVGTGNFSFRNKDGSFSEEKFKEKSLNSSVKMIELKLSQGAKPSHGGLLPGVKIGAEIAEIRGIEAGKDCYSPAVNPGITSPLKLIKFISKLRVLSLGKPVGIKLCLGRPKEFYSICKAMLELDSYPDFITIDGSEGGTGAAPLEFSNRLGLPLNDGLSLVHNTLIALGLRENISLIASGKIISGFDMVSKFSLGADICNSARGMMFAIGCIQSLRCNTNECPTGIATQDPNRTPAVVPETKRHHIYNYHKNTLKSCFDLIGAMGIKHVKNLSVSDINVRADGGISRTLEDYYPQLKRGDFEHSDLSDAILKDWQQASSEKF